MLFAILVLVLDSHCQDEYFNYCPSLLWSGVGTLCVVWNVIWDYHNKMLASQKVGGSQLLGNICQADVTIKF